MSKPSSPLTWMAGVLLAVTIPSLLQAAAMPLIGTNIVYAAYCPAVLLATAILGWQAGLAVALLSMPAINILFAPPFYSLRMSPADLASMALFGCISILIILFAHTLRRTVIQLEAVAQREAFLASELAHRVKNNLTMIEALARQTHRSSGSVDGFFEALTPRLQALARAQDLLRRGDWRSCSLPALAEEALQPFDDHPGLLIDGPPCSLSPEACTPLVMALHELATNACKYGALSCPEGRVELRWSIDRETMLLHLEWQEHDGPPVSKPRRRGLGSRLLAKGNGFVDVEHRFQPDGASCRIVIDKVHPAGPDANPERISAPSFLKRLWHSSAG